jgi:predicted nucleic acid-binding protein
MIVADTDVLIDALRGREPAVARIALELKAGPLFTTAITAFELLSGAQSTREQDVVGSLLAALRVLPLTEQSAEEAAEIRRHLDSSGTPLPTADCLIAGICRAHRAILLTRNQKHFERVPGLALGHLGAGS